MLKTITTHSAPAAIGPYSQAIQYGGLLFVSGQLPLTPEGQLVEGGIREQTEQVFRNIGAILKAAGRDFSMVVKATVFMKDLSQFAEMNEVYATYFSDHKPARSTVEVAQLPRNALVEIEVIATTSVE